MFRGNAPGSRLARARNILAAASRTELGRPVRPAGAEPDHRSRPDLWPRSSSTALLRGGVDVAFEFYAAVRGQIADKKVIAVASTGRKRTAYLPAVPTVQESGIKNFEVVSWNGISVPAATLKAVVKVLTRAINEVLPNPDVQEKVSMLGMEMRGSTPEAMTERMKTDLAKWAAVIEKAGIPKHD